MKAALYARVSTEEQTQNFSIENQLEQLHNYCQHHGYQVFKEYVDAGWSGAIIERPALGMLLNDAGARLFDMVLVYKLDRLFRNNRHMYNTLAELEELGIAFASATEPFDTTTTMGKAYLGLASTFAEWERNTFIERSRDGTRKAVEKGFYSGGIVAYGYQHNRETRRLEIEEQEAKIVADIFHWLIQEGMTTHTIAAKLNTLGIPTRYKKDGRGIRGIATAGIWRPGRIYHMLRNPAYMGEWTYGRRGKNRQLIKAHCPAIVDEQTFAAAQTRLKENNHWADRTHRRPYLLRGLVKCGLCGHNYTGDCYMTRKGEVRYYQCNRNGNKGNLLSERCCAPTIKADFVENLVWHQICEFIQQPEILRETLREKFDTARQAEYIAEMAQMKNRLKQFEEGERRLLVKFADPTTNYTEEALDGALAEIHSYKETLTTRLQELQTMNASYEEENRKIKDIGDIIETLRERVKEASLETKRKIFELLLKEIKVGESEEGKTTLHITYWFSKDLIDEDKNCQLHSSRMPLWLLGRPLQGVYLLTRSGLQIPEANQRAIHGPG